MAQDTSEYNIHVISTSSIKIKHPPESTAPSRINLTPSDLGLLFFQYNQKGLLFLKPYPARELALLSKTNSLTLIHHLKASLQRTLHFFPPFAGRLATVETDDPPTTCFYIDCKDDSDAARGAVFIHATVDMTVAGIIDASACVPEIIASFFPLNGVCNASVASQPLLAVQVTELADGLFIGCSINHMLADGTSFWHFVNSWAEMSRGDIPVDGPVSKLPLFTRDKLNIDLSGSSSIHIPNKYLIQEEIAATDLANPLEDRVFVFSKQSIASLKETANRQVPESNGKISSLQALIAHIWRSIIRCRSPSGIQETTSFEIPMGARQRLDPPLPEEYFGNAVFLGIVTLETQKILEKGLGWTAWQINRVVAAGKGPHITEFYTKWIKKPEFQKFEGLPRNYFTLINSPRFNVYGNDFGWGKPVAARTGAANRCDGRIAITGGLEEGSMEIEACLFAQTLSALAQDAEFMAFVKSPYRM